MTNAPYIFAAYGVVLVAMLGMAAGAMLRLRAARRRLAAVETAARGRRGSRA